MSSFGKGYGSHSKENCQKPGEINTVAMIDLRKLYKSERECFYLPLSVHNMLKTLLLGVTSLPIGFCTNHFFSGHSSPLPTVSLWIQYPIQ